MNILFLLPIFYISGVFGTRRFVLDNDNDFGGSVGFSALAINTCFKPSGEGAVYYKYTCSADGTTVTKTSYSNAACSAGASVIETFSDSETSPCGGDKFECDSNGVDDYAMIKVYVEWPTGSCASSLSVTTLPIVPGCFCNSASESYQASCTSDSAGNLLRYSALDCGGTASESVDLSDCTFTTQVTDPMTLDVSYKMTKCSKTQTDGPTPAPIPGVSINPTLSPLTASPTMEPVTSEPTVSPLTSSPTEATSEPTGAPISVPSRFVLDNDWALPATYAFPFDMCLQMQPSIPFASMTPEFVYYECNDDTGNVDKYKWTVAEVAGISASFDCEDTSSAIQTEFAYDASKTNCDVGYFNCDGDDNYATISLSTQIFGADLENWDCASATTDLITTSIATKVCFCDSSNAETVSGSLVCDSSLASALNYTGGDCSGEFSTTNVGGANECSHFITVEATDDLPLTLPVAATLVQCVEKGGITITGEPSSSPSSVPSASPITTTGSSDDDDDDDDDTDSSALFVTAQINILCTLVVMKILYN